MLPVYILPKYNIRPLNRILFQWLNVTTRLCSSSSSSSDSSDSDSDTEKADSKKIDVKNASSATLDNNLRSLNNMPTLSAKVAEVAGKIDSKKEAEEKATKTMEPVTDLTEYLNNIINTKKLQKKINVAIQHKKKPDEISITRQLSYEKKLRRAAENVANTLGGDKTKTTSDLLQKIFTPRAEESKKQQIDIQSQSQTIKFRELPKHKEQKSFPDKRRLDKKSIIQTLVDEFKAQPKVQPVVENSISRQLLKKAKTMQSQNIQRHARRREDIDIWNGQPNSIFENLGTTSPDIPELKTWTALKQRELKALTTYPSANIFQELILWTEQGKLWKFPIDNEQGLEEEQNVHFSEHIFLERHLKGWCPKSGPVSHFMELVCNGLSKNPYLSVQEKIDHIMWYKEYFKSKQDLLQELGAIQEPISDKVKTITE